MDVKLHETEAKNFGLYSGNIEFVIKAIKRGENVNDVNINGSTPLMCAALFGKIDIAKLLINSGAKVNTKNSKVADYDLSSEFSYNDTALMLAIEYRHLEMVELLLKAGADVSMKNRRGKNALEEAQEPGCKEEILKLIKNHVEQKKEEQKKADHKEEDDEDIEIILA